MQPSASRRRPGSRATPRIGSSTNYEALDVSMLRARAVARRPLASSIANDRPPALRRRRRLVQRSLQTRESARRDPPTHPIYHVPYEFPKGLPKIHEHDGLPAQGFGIFLGDRLVEYYSYQTDLGDGWEDPEVHHDTPELHEAALRMGVNLFTYAVSSTR